jgi:hypothetical protein
MAILHTFYLGAAGNFGIMDGESLRHVRLSTEKDSQCAS